MKKTVLYLLTMIALILTGCSNAIDTMNVNQNKDEVLEGRWLKVKYNNSTYAFVDLKSMQSNIISKTDSKHYRHNMVKVWVKGLPSDLVEKNNPLLTKNENIKVHPRLFHMEFDLECRTYAFLDGYKFDKTGKVIEISNNTIERFMAGTHKDIKPGQDMENLYDAVARHTTKK